MSFLGGFVVGVLVGAVILPHLGEVWRLLRHRYDPPNRTDVVERLKALQEDE